MKFWKNQGMKPGKDDGLTGLPPGAFRREDETPDELFYKSARLVTHIDAGAIAAVDAALPRVFPAGRGRAGFDEQLDQPSAARGRLPARGRAGHERRRAGGQPAPDGAGWCTT